MLYLWDIRSIASHNYWYDWDVTESWSVAQAQYDYFSDPENGYIYGEVIVISDTDDIAAVLEENNIQKGDLMYWSEGSDDEIHHATMISSVDDTIKYTGNTMTRFDKALEESLGNETVYIVCLRDNF